MLSNEALERVLGRLQSRFDEVNSFYIRKIAEQIKKIGRLSQANINRLVIMADMTSDVREITERLVTVTRLNAQDIQAVFNAAIKLSRGTIAAGCPAAVRTEMPTSSATLVLKSARTTKRTKRTFKRQSWVRQSI